MFFRKSLVTIPTDPGLVHRQLEDAEGRVAMLMARVNDLEAKGDKLMGEYTRAWTEHNASPESMLVVSLRELEFDLMREMHESSHYGQGPSVQELQYDIARVRMKIADAQEKDSESVTARVLANAKRAKETNKHELYAARSEMKRAAGEVHNALKQIKWQEGLVRQSDLLCGASEVESAFAAREGSFPGAHVVFMDAVAPFLRIALNIPGTDPRSSGDVL